MRTDGVKDTACGTDINNASGTTRAHRDVSDEFCSVVLSVKYEVMSYT